MLNHYDYINTFCSKVTPFENYENIIFGEVRFDYELSEMPKYFGVVTKLWHEPVINEDQFEVMKCQSNFKIHWHEKIEGNQLYPIIIKSINSLNEQAKKAFLQLSIPFLEVPCPLLESMLTELEDLAADLNSFYQN